MPTRPTRIQNPLSTVYAESFLSTAHQVSSTASVVLNTHTNMNGLCGPIQLTSEKLKILMSTPVISSAFMFATTNALIAMTCKVTPSRQTAHYAYALSI